MTLFHDGLESLHAHVDKAVLPKDMGGTGEVYELPELISSTITDREEYWNQLTTYINQ